MHVQLGTSVRVFRHPALPSGCQQSAAASELLVLVTWRDELLERWTWCTLNQGGAPNYYPNSVGGPQKLPSAAISQFSVSGDVVRWGFLQCVLMYHVKPENCYLGSMTGP